MKIFFLTYETGNGYSCSCCSRWDTRAEVLQIEAEDYEDVVQTLIQMVEAQMGTHDTSDGISLSNLVNGATGIDYANFGGVPNLFHKLLIARNTQRQTFLSKYFWVCRIDRSSSRIFAKVMEFDEQLKSGLITPVGHLKWSEAHYQELEEKIRPIRESIAKAKASLVNETADELRKLIATKIYEADRGQSETED